MFITPEQAAEVETFRETQLKTRKRLRAVQHELGKDIGSDVEQGKNTYPALIGMEKSKKRANNLINEAISALCEFDEKAEPLRAIARYVVERNN